MHADDEDVFVVAAVEDRHFAAGRDSGVHGARKVVVQLFFARFLNETTRTPRGSTPQSRDGWSRPCRTCPSPAGR